MKSNKRSQGVSNIDGDRLSESGLTALDVAIHSINHDRGFEGLGGSRRGAVGSRLAGRFIGRLLRGFGGLGAGSLGPVVVGKVFLQPLGREAHGRYRISGGGRGGARGRGVGLRKLGRVVSMRGWASIRFLFVLYRRDIFEG